MKVALVTGSSQGIGQAIALDLEKHGYMVIGNNRTTGVDVTQVDSVAQLIETISQQPGQLDVLINTVGDLGPYQPLPEYSWADFQQVIASNLYSVQLCIQAATELLRASHGRIINFACAEAEFSLPRKYTVPYYIAKQGVVTLTKSWAAALAADGVTVNAIAPGIVENSQITLATPMNRPASFNDILGAVHYLLSPAANYVSGAIITVSGGWSSTL
ncbi:MAG: SDR family oxidoreductase [Candidatus Kerfeldbacteria bacterium]|nr:SDR family oxidoreductase [Candidatus Kerfeldbacteria bacterium]